MITGKSVTWTRSTRPAAISARFIDRLPWERNGTVGLLLEPGDDVDGVAAHERSRPASRAGPSRVLDTTVAGRFRIRVTHGSRTSDSSVLAASICANAR